MLFGGQERAATSAEGRRRAILEAALRVIAQGGPDAVTHRRVAGEAEVPLGSLTYYFDSREDLLREAFRHYLTQAGALLRGIEREIPATTASDIVELVAEITRREFMDPAMMRAEYEMILYAGRDATISREFNAWERNLEARLAGSLEMLGAARPIDAARTIIHLVRAAELERLARPGIDAGDLRRRLLPVVKALTAPPETGGARAGISHTKPATRQPRVYGHRTVAQGKRKRRTGQ